jgi:hypothetical protein
VPSDGSVNAGEGVETCGRIVNAAGNTLISHAATAFNIGFFLGGDDL